MKKALIILIVASCSAGGTMAQRLKVVKATRQNTNGGVAGMHGSNYYILIKSGRGKEVLDSIYIDGEAFKLRNKENLNVDSIHHTYAIVVGVSHNDYRYVQMNPNGTDSVSTHPFPVSTFPGAALLVYHYRGVKHTLIIKELRALPTLNYP